MVSVKYTHGENIPSIKIQVLTKSTNMYIWVFQQVVQCYNEKQIYTFSKSKADFS